MHVPVCVWQGKNCESESVRTGLSPAVQPSAPIRIKPEAAECWCHGRPLRDQTCHFSYRSAREETRAHKPRGRPPASTHTSSDCATGQKWWKQNWGTLKTQHCWNCNTNYFLPMCGLLVKKKKKSCTTSSNSCTPLRCFYPAHSSESRCIQASSWELSVMFPADKSHLLCRGERMVQLQPVHQHYTAHGGDERAEMKRKGDQTKDKLLFLKIESAQRATVVFVKRIPPLRGRRGTTRGAGETRLVWLLGGYSGSKLFWAVLGFFGGVFWQGQMKQSLGCEG